MTLNASWDMEDALYQPFKPMKSLIKNKPILTVKTDTLTKGGPGSGIKGHVAAIAVTHGTKMLMGKRRDNGKWTNPGGHLDEGEKPLDAAVRELREETGIEAKPEHLNHLGSKDVITPTGEKKKIHAYHYVIDEKQKTSHKQDPDKEVHGWDWVETKGGMPKKVSTNLHSPRNVLLEKLGIKHKAMLIVTDILKSGSMPGHKYIRKYMRNGQWVYIYHEHGQKPRALPEEAIHHLKQMAEAGHEHAKALHESIQAHDEGKLEHLRKMADLGHAGAKDHLHSLGIDREAERVEDAVVRNKDPSEKDLPPAKLTEAIQIVRREIESARAHLSQHASTPIGLAVLPSLAAGKLNAHLDGARSAGDIIEGLKKITEQLEAKQGVIAAQRPGNHKTYGNMIYNQAMEKLEAAQIVPKDYAKAHKREGRQAETKHTPFKKHEEEAAKRRAAQEAREARERAEREERDRRELAEIHGSMAHHISTLSTRPMDIEAIKKLHRAFKNIFGKDLRKEDWPYDFTAHGVKTKVTVLRSSDGEITLQLHPKDASGNDLVTEWRRSFYKGDDGRPNIHNDYLAVPMNQRGTLQIGNLINQGQRKLMRSLPGGGTIDVFANIDIGGYNWANQGFSFTDSSTLTSFRRKFQLFCAERGTHLTDADMLKFKEPVHFAAFKNGKKEVKTLGQPINLSRSQLESKSLTGVPGEFTLTDSEIANKTTKRMACDIGKLFLARSEGSWNGKWDSRQNTEASRYADKYYELRDRAASELDGEYQGVVAAVKAGERRGRVPAPTTITPRSSIPASSESSPSGHSSQAIRNWTPRDVVGASPRSIRMSPQRMARIERWPAGEAEHFLRNARITRDAKNRIREIISRRATT